MTDLTSNSSIVLNLSEDAYAGDAQFTVSVDGTQVGGVQTVTAAHSSGQSQAFTLPGTYVGAHTVAINFLNDAWGGNASKDRNLYVDSIQIGGETYKENKEQGNNGSVAYVVAPQPIVSITSQSLNASTSSVSLTGTVSAAPGTTVNLLNGKSVLGMAAVASDGTWSFQTTLPNGSYAINAVATDPNGYSGSTTAQSPLSVANPNAPTVAHPFSASSAWNTLIGANAQYQSSTGAQSAELKQGANAWIGADAMGIYQATDTDPLATWTYQSSEGISSAGAGSVQIRTPSNLAFNGSDKWAIIVSPDQQNYYETWLGSANAGSGTYSAAYLVKNNINGTGFATTSNPSQGIRAAGASLLGGLVTTQDLNTLSIQHAIAMAIAPSQAAAGATTASQYVYPATGADGNSLWNYSGNIPIGSQFAIPKNVDLTKIGIQTPEGLALAKAYQNYGGYVVDTADYTDQLAYLQTGATQQQISDLFKDVGTIRSYLSLVTDPANGAPASSLPATGDQSASTPPASSPAVPSAPVAVVSPPAQVPAAAAATPVSSAPQVPAAIAPVSDAVAASQAVQNSAPVSSPAILASPLAHAVTSNAPDTSAVNYTAHDNGSNRVDVGAAGQTAYSNYYDTFYNNGNGGTQFVFQPGFERDVISQFRVNGSDHDTLVLPASDFMNVADVLRNTRMAGGSAVITDPNSGDTIKLQGITKTQLAHNRSDFAFA